MALLELKALFEGEAMGLPYGEDISIRDHMLQCAELAVRQGLADAVIAAALLHDIGWAMAGEGTAAAHEQVAAAMLEPVFGARVAAPVRLHVAAKRYLVGRDPAYADRLSTCSRQTLIAQGGPFTPESCLAFEREAHFEAAVALRHLDDAGKALRPARSRFADYAGLLARLAHEG